MKTALIFYDMVEALILHIRNKGCPNSMLYAQRLTEELARCRECSEAAKSMDWQIANRAGRLTVEAMKDLLETMSRPWIKDQLQQMSVTNASN